MIKKILHKQYLSFTMRASLRVLNASYKTVVDY
jgi:hypothetical protein